MCETVFCKTTDNNVSQKTVFILLKSENNIEKVSGKIKFHKNNFEMSSDQYRSILTCFCTMIATDLNDYSNKDKKMRLPILPMSMLKELLEETKRIFKEEKVFLQVRAPVVVVGDIHGHILDLLRIIKEYHLPPNQRYLFLGDFVDRGHFSLETVILVLVLKVLFPSDVYLIRGNHEFSEVCDHSSFQSEIINIYNDESLLQLFMDTFSYMPLAASVDDYALCLHGGIGESLVFTSQFNDLERPIIDFQNPLVTETLWSDPTNESGVDYKESPRGMGNLFGQKPLTYCLERNGFRYLVRGHQCVPNGCESSINHRVMTVFSASNYCGVEENKSGVLILLPGENYETATFPPFKNIIRNEASFVPLDIYHSSPRKHVAGASNRQAPNSDRKLFDRRLSVGGNENAVRSMKEVPRFSGMSSFPVAPPKSAREMPNRFRRYNRDDEPGTARSHGGIRSVRKLQSPTVVKPIDIQRNRRVSMPNIRYRPDIP
ncbi:Ser/Thr protein phosphatase [Tritrichomonas foetus]|uniref:Serine/threonine-protein phosphatase n=1 Tax=Tritrichomonas foetus TaxID=1144522 RepID=A0A1J4KMA9_9EUKA|nr:Ser/Thr protein phosphatase [Tritrichomonas foetus]|eukprot:OHT12447.1 Ser/Thr protein phosphatase [Tritrichomonas foetus]